jgi:hypothetical protein
VAKELKLTRGFVAIVDDDVFEYVSQWRWHYDGPYAQRREMVDGVYKKIYLHRLILGVTDPKTEVDHINGNPLDNRRANLRIATKSENGRNRGAQSNGKSRFKGVHYEKARNKWRAEICVNKRKIYLGRFDSEIDAAKAYNDAAVSFHGEFARLNNLEGDA